MVKDASDAMAGISWDAFRSKSYELLPPQSMQIMHFYAIWLPQLKLKMLSLKGLANSLPS